jgi:putative transposase
MARHPRSEGAGALHHVVAQAASESRIVRDDSDRLHFLDEARRGIGETGWICVAYCLMDTHVHLVVCTPEPNLGLGMQRLLGRYAFAHNRRHGRHGHLFSDRFWSRRIDRPHYLWCACLYAVLNPVKAGLCAHPAEFAWSSYRETVGLTAATGLLEPEYVLRTLADDPSSARDIYIRLVDESLDRLRRRRVEEAWWKTVERAVGDMLPDVGVSRLR